MTEPVPCEGGVWEPRAPIVGGTIEAVCSICKRPAIDHPHQHTPLLLVLRTVLTRNLALDHDIKALACRSCGARTALGKPLVCKLKHPAHGHMPLSSPPCIVDGLTYESAKIALT